MRYVELFNNRVIRFGEAVILPVLAFPSDAIDITNYDGDIKVGYKYNNELKVFEYGEVERPEPDEPKEPPVEPEVPKETLEEKLARLEEKIEMFNLINTDISLSVYEEILALRNEVTSLKGVTE